METQITGDVAGLRRVTVVIPTFNRKEVLARVLRALLAQSVVDQLREVIVVDDGSTDGTQSQVETIGEGSAFPFRYIRQANRGQGAARNLGIREATGEILLFLDDDIIPAPNLLAEHLQWHDRYPKPATAVLGFVTWSPEVRPTPFMHWLGLDGPLFDHGHFNGKTELDFRAFYTCNLSLKTSFLRQSGGFDEDFTGYGFEDIELGYRLQKLGLRLLYNPAALGHHYKHMTFADACRRARVAARAFPIFESKEAGKYFLELQAQGKAFIPPERLYKKLLWPALRPLKKAVLAPLRLLVDTQVPLPWKLYWRLYNEASQLQAPASSRPGAAS